MGFKAPGTRSPHSLHAQRGENGATARRDDIIRANEDSPRETKTMKLIGLVAWGLSGLMGLAAHAAPSPWQQPAAALAGRIADILGPGRAHLTIQNLSSLSNDEIPAIRQLLEQDLQSRGVMPAGPDSANLIRVTLSESARERLWVAEVIEGDETQVAMVDVGPVTAVQPQIAPGLTLRSQQVLAANTPILAALETPAGLLVLEPEQILLYAQQANAWSVAERANIGQTRPLPRAPRGILLPTQNGQGFEAWLAGTACTGSVAADGTTNGWTVDCRQSDDPWIVSQTAIAQATPAPTQPTPAQTPLAPTSATPVAAPSLKAFYNAARDYFTGIVVPNPNVELPPFYSAVLLPRPAGGDALLIGGIDGKVQLLEDGALTSIDGARDWGSDFAALHSGCSPSSQVDTQIVASGSGEALSDSLRAYDLPALEAVPASAPLAMNGTVMALWTAPDGKSVLAVVRDAPDQYEVDRVTASCN